MAGSQIQDPDNLDRELLYALHDLDAATSEAEVWRAVERAAAASPSAVEPEFYRRFLQELARVLNGNRKQIRNPRPWPNLTLAEAFGFRAATGAAGDEPATA